MVSRNLAVVTDFLSLNIKKDIAKTVREFSIHKIKYWGQMRYVKTLNNELQGRSYIIRGVFNGKTGKTYPKCLHKLTLSQPEGTDYTHHIGFFSPIESRDYTLEFHVRYYLFALV